VRLGSKSVALISTFTALGLALRVAKNLATSVQFVNIPLLFGFLAAFFAGPRSGFLTTALIYLLSYLFILPGVWTITNMVLGGLAAAAFGAASNLIRTFEHRFALAFLLCFLFDVSSSVLLYVFFGVPLVQALIVGVVGLFLPVMGGYLIGVGPLTEFTTALLSVLLADRLRKIFGKEIEKN